MTRPLELQSHIGRAANQILLGGWSEAGTIITRKAAMNIKLIGSTIWSWVFMVTLLVLALLVFRQMCIRDRPKTLRYTLENLANVEYVYKELPHEVYGLPNINKCLVSVA